MQVNVLLCSLFGNKRGICFVRVLANIRRYTHFSLYQILDAAVSGFFFRKIKITAQPNQTRHVQVRDGSKPVATIIKFY